jgi:hypothetical protein
MKLLGVNSVTPDSLKKLKNDETSCKKGKDLYMIVHIMGENDEIIKKHKILEKLRKKIEDKKKKTEFIEEEIRELTSSS